ncbi:MAG TPA: ASKHA domain-containing protein [Anaerovoracaceae bacterium]|nr:ASKHA domain-containing protein [Anaerovoracaceae bacterium]
MKIFDEAELAIEQDEIVKLLGYKDRLPQEDVLELIREEVNRSGEYLEPVSYYEDIEIERIENNRVLLKNQVVFEGEFIAGKLKGCSRITAVIATVGSKVTERVQEAFDQDDYLRGMVIDNIGLAALGHLNRLFWIRMGEAIRGTDQGITQTLSPGDTDWDLWEETKIFNCFGDGFNQVSLTESCLMLPEKSTAQVYGFGKGIGIARQGHICAECSMRHCFYRQDGKVGLTVCHEGVSEVIDVEPGMNLLDVLRQNDLFVENPCSGKLLCGKCRVKIKRGLEEPAEHDLRHLTKEDLGNGWRLSCGICIKGPMEVILEKKGGIEVLTGGRTQWYEVEPPAERIDCRMDPPSVHDQRDDLQRLRQACGTERLTAGIEDLALIGGKLRDNQFNVTAVVYRDQLLELTGIGGIERFYGVAVDIGTTTVAAYLMDLSDGTQVDVESAVNSQRKYGADVISRIDYTIENPEGLAVLRNSIREQVSGMISALCRRNGITEEFVYNVTVAGNTTMTHLLLGLPCDNIAQAPYIPVTNSALEVGAGELGLKTKGIVSIIPGIAAYVGSDITAGILSCGMLDSQGYSVLLDIGTNGEIAIGNCNEIITCSTAAGPAFEGSNIRHGIGGVKGAISKIDLFKDKIYETIGGEDPVGICGSGVLDATAQLVKYGIVDGTGRMREAKGGKHKGRIAEIDGMKQLVVARRSSGGELITFTQKDVREVQLAKAAINAGINLLIKEKELEFSQIENVYIGGGFGNFMNIESAVTIGMIPRELQEKIRSVGNCAGSGAKAYLLSKALRSRAVEIADMARYIELSARKDFQDYYIEAMIFEPK